MDKQIIAIGGGGFGRYRNRLEIESYLLSKQTSAAQIYALSLRQQVMINHTSLIFIVLLVDLIATQHI